MKDSKRVPTIVSLPENTNGRDFIIGDLHGCLALLQEKLDSVSFNKDIDRLFSVGDLCDRGPNSVGCLELLYEPWFFAVRGNHEMMYSNWLNQAHSYYASPNDFIRNGGDWIYSVDHQMREEYDFLIREKMPFIYDVGAEDGFYIAHSFYDEETINMSEEGFVWNRDVFRGLPRHRFNLEAFLALPPLSLVKLNEMTDKITYVGHNTIKHKLFFDNHLFIDTGAYKRVCEENMEFDLTILEHKATHKLLMEMDLHGQTNPGVEKTL